METYQIEQRDNGSYLFRWLHPFAFELGGEINPLELTYETYGTLNAAKNNAILIHHALSTNSHVSSHSQNPTPGWWENMVGPDRPIDTERYFVICINNLGSCFGSSGPTSINPQTHRPYQVDFPVVTLRDMVRSQHLLLEILGISHLYAVIGSSVGAMLSLAWAVEYSDSLDYLISISSCYKSYPANIANRVVQREIIKLDPAWQKGYYTENPTAGLKIARKLGHFTYRNPHGLNEKFAENHKVHPDVPCEIENYLEYNATKFASYFDTNSYLCLLTAMDLYDVTKTYGDAQTTFARLKAKTLVVSVDSDILFTPAQQQDLYHALQNAHCDVTYIAHPSIYGHDTFLVETDAIGNYIRDFLNTS